ncbi:glutathione S-transferase [Litorivivens lipolytica]|uniref:Glutathione S-transferase n=1 Tax=Litorivivens lipolytica TaxID=1524264 RepID=A0A7W4W2W6_9GAMM|nr:glutathione S-transferase family protein [Litorivivens lipolytica]MBB3046168.1 glutathione S-transferase [Litorivivens lipolytica]
MKLYTFDIAPNPRRLTMFLQYKGIEIDTQQIDLGKLEQFSDSFRAINPDCSVPALELDDGIALVDVVSICLYLESLHPEKPLFGKSDLERAQVVGWMHRLFTSGLMAIADMLRNQGDMFKDRALPGPGNLKQIPELVERGRIRLDQFFARMEEVCAEQDYLVGDALTQADIDLLAVCEFAGWVKVSVPESCTNLHAYLERVRAQLAG